MRAADFSATRRVIIYRLGGLGDTLVALPSFRLVQRAFPHAERCLLTTRPSPREPWMFPMLEAAGIVRHSISYERGERRPGALLALMREIRAYRADVLVYLTEPRGLLPTWRDVAFFRACGIRRIVGAPLTPDLATCRHDAEAGLWEREASRLARTLAPLGDAELDDPASWAPVMQPQHVAEAERLLNGWAGRDRFVAASVDTKISAKDWSEENWAEVLGGLSAADPSLGLMLFGGAADSSRSRRLTPVWRGPVMMACGYDVQVSAALLRDARLFISMDSGPMHLAAALGVPTVTVFSGVTLPGIWYPPYGRGTILTHATPCRGCLLEDCTEHGRACILAIKPTAVLGACRTALGLVPVA